MSQRGSLDTQDKPGRAAAAVTSGALRMIDGVWYLDTGPGAVPDGFLIDVDGVPTVDDEATSGQRVLKSPRPVLSY